MRKKLNRKKRVETRKSRVRRKVNQDYECCQCEQYTGLRCISYGLSDAMFLNAWASVHPFLFYHISFVLIVSFGFGCFQYLGAGIPTLLFSASHLLLHHFLLCFWFFSNTLVPGWQLCYLVVHCTRRMARMLALLCWDLQTPRTTKRNEAPEFCAL